MPFAGVLGGATYLAIKGGYLKPSASYGSIPKVCAAVAVGYFIGKLSFQTQCSEMLMALPNSKLAEMLRARQKGSIYGQLSPDQGYGTGLSLAPFSSPTDSYSDEATRKSSSLDMDTNRPSNPGLDDVYRPTLDNSPPVTNYDDVILPLEPPKQGVTYDELRKKNRDEHYLRMQQQQQPPQQAPTPQLAPPNMRPSVSRPLETPEEREVRRNKYGDIWTESK